VASLVESQGYAGDEGNFEALYSTYRSDVQRLASYLLKNAADAEDASQTVFMNVLRALRQGVRPAEPRAWLMAITRNVCFSRRRAVSCRPAEVELDPERASEAADADIPRIDDIVGALARMLPNQRTALILRDFRGASHGEICELLAMSPAGVETLLTRARTSFREEMEAGDQPFDCAETKALVEQQLAGKITVAERHSLRTHLRHCGPCSTLARAVRSSKGKLAGLLFWPVDLFQRLASALSQAPSVAHVAVAVTSTAAVAAVAIPVAVTHVFASSNHVEGRTGPGLVASSAAHTQTAHTVASAAATAQATGPASTSHVHTHVARQAHAARATKTTKAHSAARAAAGASVALAAAAPGTQATTPASAGATTAPAPGVVHQVSPHAAASLPAVQQPVAVPPRSPAPAVKPAKSSGHPKKTKPAARHKPVAGRHPTDPATKPPASSDPLASLPTPTTSGPATNSGGGVTMGSDSANTTTQSTDPSSSSSSGQSSGGGQSSSTTNAGSSGNNDDHGHKKPKHGH
jgi:RNA polymerase sigma-70 factor, ECF subfamily